MLKELLKDKRGFATNLAGLDSFFYVFVNIVNFFALLSLFFGHIYAKKKKWPASIPLIFIGLVLLSFFSFLVIKSSFDVEFLASQIFSVLFLLLAISTYYLIKDYRENPNLPENQPIEGEKKLSKREKIIIFIVAVLIISFIILKIVFD